MKKILKISLIILAALILLFVIPFLLQNLLIPGFKMLDNPNQEINSKVKAMFYAPGSASKTAIITFNQSQPILNSETIARQTGIN